MIGSSGLMWGWTAAAGSSASPLKTAGSAPPAIAFSPANATIGDTSVAGFVAFINVSQRPTRVPLCGDGI